MKQSRLKINLQELQYGDRDLLEEISDLIRLASILKSVIRSGESFSDKIDEEFEKVMKRYR